MNNKKLIKLVNQMTDNVEENYKTISKNYKIVKQILNNKKMLFDLMKIDCDEQKVSMFFECILTFPQDINIKVNPFTYLYEKDKNGNTFLHIIPENNHSLRFIFNILNSIKLRNFNISVLNHLLYEVNNDRDMFMHIVLKDIIKNKKDINDDFINLLDFLLKNNFDYRYSYNHINKTVHEYIGIILNSINVSSDKIHNIKYIIYENYFFEFLDDLSENKEKDIELINDIYGDINYCDEKGSLLNRSTRIIGPVKNIINNVTAYKTRDDIINKCKLLLEYGIDPNLRDKNGNTFLHNIIELMTKEDEQIFDLINCAIDRGFDVNQRPTVLKSMLDFCPDNKRILKYYEYFIDKGYNTAIGDFNYDEIVKAKETAAFPQSSNKESYFKIMELAKFREIVDYIIYKLDQEGFKVEDGFVEKFCWIYKDFVVFKAEIQSFSEITNDKNILMRLTKLISDNRKNSVIVKSEKITVEEVLEGLKLLFLDLQTDFFNKIDRSKQKIKR